MQTKRTGRSRIENETLRSISLVCLLGSLVLLAACTINPAGVYRPFALTFGIAMAFMLASAIGFGVFSQRLRRGQ